MKSGLYALRSPSLLTVPLFLLFFSKLFLSFLLMVVEEFVVSPEDGGDKEYVEDADPVNCQLVRPERLDAAIGFLSA